MMMVMMHYDDGDDDALLRKGEERDRDRDRQTDRQTETERGVGSYYLGTVYKKSPMKFLGAITVHSVAPVPSRF